MQVSAGGPSEVDREVASQGGRCHRLRAAPWRPSLRRVGVPSLPAQASCVTTRMAQARPPATETLKSFLRSRELRPCPRSDDRLQRCNKRGAQSYVQRQLCQRRARPPIAFTGCDATGGQAQHVGRMWPNLGRIQSPRPGATSWNEIDQSCAKKLEMPPGENLKLTEHIIWCVLEVPLRELSEINEHRELQGSCSRGSLGPVSSHFHTTSCSFRALLGPHFA